MNQSESTDFIAESLESIAESYKFNEWLISQFSDELNGNKLWEIGAGTGNISDFFQHYKELYLTEYEDIFLNKLHQKYDDKEHIHVERADLTDLDIEKYKKREIDNIICVNVLEHIEDDVKALENINKVMHSNTKFAILIPAHPILYGAMDKQAGHFRRYTKSELIHKLETTGFEILKLKHFNKVSALGWFIKGRLMKNPKIGKNDMKIVELLLPILKLEKFFPIPFGQSLIAITKLKKSSRE